MSPTARRAMVSRGHPDFSVAVQCALLKVPRSTVYYRPKAIGDENLALMRRIDEIYTKWPFYGARKMVAELRGEGYAVNRKRVRRLMRLMGIEAIYQKPNTSRKHPDHKIYPYLLKDLTIGHANQVWCADISYIPMAKGFVYLVAVMDWFSRRVLAWRLSITMETDFCVEALQEAMDRYGKPEICKVGDERRAAFWCGQFLVASFRTGRAPFVTHPALQKTRRSQASSSRRGGIVRSWSIRADIVRCSLHARAVS